MVKRQRLALVVLVGLFLSSPSAVWAEQPVLSREQITHFLLSADIIASKRTGIGFTRPWRLTLSDGTMTHDAAFQSVDRFAPVQQLRRGREFNFVDAYRYNIAAYLLAELVGLGHMMPVYVERTWNGRRGSLSWWLDDITLDERTRQQEGRRPPDLEVWNAQMYRMWVFDALVHDTDRNQTNLLYTSDWKLFMIDFSRAFRRWDRLQRPNDLARCDRQLFERLTTLTSAEVTQATQPYLTDGEVEAVLQRRDTLMRHFRDLIDAKGEDAVLY